MENIDQILPKYLLKLGAPISKKYCQKLIVSHPEFPSLLSLSEVMERLGVPHQIAKIDKEDLSNLEFPYLLHLESNGGEMIPVHTNSDLLLNKERLDYWSGIVLQAEMPNKILDQQNNEALMSDKFTHQASIIMGIAAILLLITPLIYNFSLLPSLIWLSAGTGTIIGYLLFSKDLGITYKKIETFCNTGTQANCDKVLNSTGAKLFGSVSLSNIVLAYFSIQLIAITGSLAVVAIQQDIFLTLKWWGILSTPVIIYSLYYQKFIAKTWCKLCLLVNAILVSQLVVYLADQFYGTQSLIPSKSIISIALCLIFLIATILVTLVKDYCETYINVRQNEEKAYRTKHNPYVLKHLLGAKQVDTTPFAKEIRIGNESAPIQIIMASNLYCNPCKEQHAIASQLVAMYPDKVSVSFRFVLSGADVGRVPTSIQYIIMYWLENIYAKPRESEKTESMMHTWFAVMDLDKFMSLMPLKTNNFNKESELLGAAHYVWLNKVKVNMTPTFFINGYKLPKNYLISDLKAIIPSLVDLFPQNSFDVSAKLTSEFSN